MSEQQQASTAIQHTEHPYAVPYRNRDGEVVTITADQMNAVWHALGVWSRLCEDEGCPDQADPARWPINVRKSRALGRLLLGGKPLFAERPPMDMGAADYALWDAENEAVGNGS